MGNRPEGGHPHLTQSQLVLRCFPAPYRNDQRHNVGHDRTHKTEQTKHFRYFVRLPPDKHREHRFRPMVGIVEVHQEEAS